MIKYLFNHHGCSIIHKKALVNTSQAFPPKWAKSISVWAKCKRKRKENNMEHAKLPHRHGDVQQTELIQKQLKHVDYFQTVAEVFKQLGDTTRIRIFWLLCHREECVLNISAMLDMSSPAVSHHLRPLKNSGLIICRREGKEVYYRAADTEQGRLLHQMIEQVMEITCPEL
jgi:DNA-binding transcriptional ArsR family regulator